MAALAPLADAADLSARGVVDADGPLATVMLAVASTLVREAAGRSPISETESTLSLWLTDDSQWLPIPGQPVTAVHSVTLDGEVLEATRYKLIHGQLWLRGYRAVCEPLEVVVEITHGYADVPDSIVQLVCDLAILGMGAAEEGAVDPRVVAEQIDDYKVTFAPGAELVSSAMELPPATRRALLNRFGGRR